MLRSNAGWMVMGKITLFNRYSNKLLGYIIIIWNFQISIKNGLPAIGRHPPGCYWSAFMTPLSLILPTRLFLLAFPLSDQSLRFSFLREEMSPNSSWSSHLWRVLSRYAYINLGEKGVRWFKAVFNHLQNEHLLLDVWKCGFEAWNIGGDSSWELSLAS
jgi:hypothetical protein